MIFKINHSMENKSSYQLSPTELEEIESFAEQLEVIENNIIEFYMNKLRKINKHTKSNNFEKQRYSLISIKEHIDSYLQTYLTNYAIQKDSKIKESYILHDLYIMSFELLEAANKLLHSIKINCINSN